MAPKKLHPWPQLIGFRTTAIVLFFAVLTILITYILYSYTQELLKNRLQERLIAIAATAAIQFDPKDILQIKGAENTNKAVLERLVSKLKGIRDSNKNIRYAYLMRRTDDPLVLEFVADAESLATFDELDSNKDGVVQAEEVTPLPGDPFEIQDYPVLRDEAFFHPAADRVLHQDQWSVQMSAYAPIIDDTGTTVAIFGIDVIVDDFLRLTQATFLPFLLFILFLIMTLTLMTILVARFWHERVEIMREIDRQKDELLSIVSHQLATPVSSVKWYIEMMLDGDVGDLTNEQKDHLKTVQSVSVDLSDLVSMILDVSRIQLGKVRVDKQELDLNAFFSEILNTVSPKAKQKNLAFSVSVPKDLPKAMLDKRYTRMTIENILTNAIKYTPEKRSVTFDVKIQNDTLHCRVVDTGCGIPKEDQKKIFGRMFRAGNVRNGQDGNGFGLYVAKGAVEAQGGKIWFTSTENKGTTFFVELPLHAI